MQERRLAAIMFTDIVGYTSLMGSDEDQAFEVLRSNREIHQQLIGKFNGSLIKEMGDGMLISFPLVTDAVRCAIELQTRCIVKNIPLKIGIHEGEMVFENNDVLGDGVNIAARIQENARAGSILVSHNVYNDIKSKTEFRTRLSGDKKLKNVKELMKIYEVLPTGQPISIKKEDKAAGFPLYYYISGGVIITLIILFLVWKYLISNPSSIQEKEKTIAVMPFDDESPAQDNNYFVNGMMEDIRNNLSRISGFSVTSKTTMEKYGASKLSIPEIAKEVNVNFILEGTVTIINNRVKIYAQLIDAATDHHIWGETYERDLTDVFKIQSEIAQIIARKLHLTISPEELNIIETPPTANLKAYELYNQAREYQKTYLMEGNSVLSLGVLSIRSDHIDDLDRAISLYQEAIILDSTFAQAYSSLGMALALKNMYISGINTDELTFDTLLNLANKALLFNPQLDEAFLLKGVYYRNDKSRIFEAIENLKKAIDINPSYALAYVELGSIYAWELIDYVEGLALFQKAYHLDKSYLAPIILESHYNAFLNVRLFDKADSFRNAFFELKKNAQQGYYGALAWTAWCKNDINASIDWALKKIEEDPGNAWALNFLANRFSYIKDFASSTKYLEISIDLYGINNWEKKASAHRLAYIFYNLGRMDEADKYFNLEIELCKKSIEIEDLSASRGLTYYDLFAVYSFLGNIEEAFKHLRSLRQNDFYPAWLMTYFYNDPLLEKVRDDQRFKDFLQEAELKLQREQQSVREWLETNKLDIPA